MTDLHMIINIAFGAWWFGILLCVMNELSEKKTAKININLMNIKIIIHNFKKAEKKWPDKNQERKIQKKMIIYKYDDDDDDEM